MHQADLYYLGMHIWMANMERKEMKLLPWTALEKRREYDLEGMHRCFGDGNDVLFLDLCCIYTNIGSRNVF